MPYLFTSKELDEETGLYYVGARYYDPRTSVWESADPMLGGFLAGQHGGVFTSFNLALYSYARLGPLSHFDPNGKFDDTAAEEVIAGHFQYSRDAKLRKFGDLNPSVLTEASMPTVRAETPREKIHRQLTEARDTIAQFALPPVVKQAMTLADTKAPRDKREMAAIGLGSLALGPVAAEADVAEVGGEALAGSADGDAFVYRGVHAGHPALADALQGRVVPGNLGGTVSEEAHNLGGVAADSPYTSWSHSFDVARSHAVKAGPGGVILRLPTGAPPPGATWSCAWSPDVYGEQEVLLRGLRGGATVMKP